MTHSLLVKFADACEQIASENEAFAKRFGTHFHRGAAMSTPRRASGSGAGTTSSTKRKRNESASPESSPSPSAPRSSSRGRPCGRGRGRGCGTGRGKHAKNPKSSELVEDSDSADESAPVTTSGPSNPVVPVTTPRLSDPVVPVTTDDWTSLSEPGATTLDISAEIAEAAAKAAQSQPEKSKGSTTASGKETANDPKSGSAKASGKPPP